MVGILKKGVGDGGCFRRSRSANSVNISTQVEVIDAESVVVVADQPATSSEPLPLDANSVKVSEGAVDSHTEESTQAPVPQKNDIIFQRSVSDTGLESGTSLDSRTELGSGTILEQGTVFESDTDQNSEPQLLAENKVTAFPSLPDTVLKTMSLLVNSKKDRDSLSEDDVESRFTSLSVAFKTDQLTLSTRMELQKRQRDQAECNMSAEVTRLKSAIHKLNRVYVDAESIENLTEIQTLVDILQQATARVSSSAEMFGAVQQEHRLSLTTEVLMTHVENVKRSLQKMHLQLEELKRILADNNIMLEENPDLMDEPTPRTHRYRSLAGIMTANKKVGSKRRASIAAMPRPLGISTDSSKVIVSPSTAQEQKIRMASVVNAIRRKTSVSPGSTQSFGGLEVREWSEQVSDAMEEIEEIGESHGVANIEDQPSVGSLEDCTCNSDSMCPLLFVENEDIAQVFTADGERKQEELVMGQTEKLPNTFQAIVEEMKRHVIEAQSQIIDLFENHRSTIIERLRWSVAAVLIGLAACFLVWIIFPSADATSNVRRYTLEELLQPCIRL